MEALNVPELLRIAGLPRHQAVRALREALAADRIWRVSLFQDPRAAELMADPEVAAIVAEAAGRMAAHGLQPQIAVAGSGRTGLRPLVLALHGARGNARLELDVWRPAAALGYTVAAAQSSQPSAPGLFCWDPPRDRIRRDLAEIRRRLPPTGRVVLAGFSQGAWLALDEALRGDLFQPAAVILVAPFVGDLDGLPPAFRRLRVAVVAGADDPYSARAEALLETLVERGHAASLEIVPGLGHAYPEDFADRIPALLDRVTRR